VREVYSAISIPEDCMSVSSRSGKVVAAMSWSAALALVSCDQSAPPTSAGVTAGPNGEISWVRATLQDESGGECAVAVSDCSIELEGWRYKALYRGEAGELELIGFFAVRVAETPFPCSIPAVWYGAPQATGGRWSCEAFPDTSAGCAASVLKARFGVPARQDAIWDVGPVPSALDPCVAGFDGRALRHGLLEGDALAEAIDALEPESKSWLLHALVAVGHRAVEAKPQVVDEQHRRQMLEQLRTLFLRWLATPTSLKGAACFALQSWRPSEVDMAALAEAWQRSAPSDGSPCPPAWTSPWEPDAAELCDCETIGPMQHCEQVVHSAEGEVEVVIPWPLPGKRVRLIGSANGATGWSVCGWVRRCTGMARRTHARFVPPGCTLVESDEFAEITFERWGWWPIQKMPTCAQTSCVSSPPSGMPPASVDCGLGTAVQPVR